MNAQLYDLDMFGGSMAPKPRGPVAERFGFSPFTVLDAKQGDWQERKRAWLAMGLRSELGRSAKSYNIHDWIEGNREAMQIAVTMNGDG